MKKQSSDISVLPQDHVLVTWTTDSETIMNNQTALNINVNEEITLIKRISIF